MFRNHFILHLRSLWKNRSHTLVNLLGLALGMTSSMIIFLILRLELGYEQDQPDADRIFRVVTTYTHGDKDGYSSGITYPLVPAMRSDFPEIEGVALLDGNTSPPVLSVIRSDGSEEKFKETSVVFVDPEYMDIFTMKWIEGDHHALHKEKTIVLTESTARKYFGEESALNKVINFNSEFDATITGVVADPPVNTDLSFKVYVTNNTGAKKRGWEEWSGTSSSMNCFVKLHPGTTEEQLEAKLKGWHMKYFTGPLEEEGRNRNYSLQPLTEMHTDIRFHNFGGKTVTPETLYALALIGIVLLLTACINFINLNTVLIIDRSKEAGVRKVLGSSRQQIVAQFMMETLTITFVSMIISGGLVELALLNLTPLLGYTLSFHALTDPVTLAFLIILPLAVACLAGLYPAVRLSGFKPVHALKSRFASDTGKGLHVRRSLIVTQLVISQVLIVCTIIVVRQLDHFMTQPLGIDSHAVIEFAIPEVMETEPIHLLKDRIEAISGVDNFTMSNTGSTSFSQWSGGFEATVDGKLVKETSDVKLADQDYIRTYGIKLIAGSDLPKSDTGVSFVVNEAFTRALGLHDPEAAVGVQVDMWGVKAMINGVVKDFNTTSLHGALRPVIMSSNLGSYRVGAVKLSTTNMARTMEEVRIAWESVFPKGVYTPAFLDDTIAQFYNNERRTSYLLGSFAGIAIFIGCIGLYGLVAFMARRKTKEIGIRKTLGATVGQVVGMFSKEFVMLVMIAFALSVPLAYYFMDKWLSNFAYKITPGVMTYATGALFTLGVVLVTIGLRSYRAAVANPVNALREE